MRIIAGEFRSRKLTTVEGVGTRPTPDRLRESLFSILGPELEGKVFADAYAGTGAVGIEALSRGARLAIFLENDRKALEAIRHNLKALKAESRSRLIPGPAARNLTKIEADILFLDPPYTKESEYAAAMNALPTPPPALVILQHSVRFETAPAYGPLTRYRILKQGENALSFYRPT